MSQIALGNLGEEALNLLLLSINTAAIRILTTNLGLPQTVCQRGRAENTASILHIIDVVFVLG